MSPSMQILKSMFEVDVCIQPMSPFIADHYVSNNEYKIEGILKYMCCVLYVTFHRKDTTTKKDKIQRRFSINNACEKYCIPQILALQW